MTLSPQYRTQPSSSSRLASPTPPTAARQVPPLLAEITPEQFALWKRHPVSDLVLSRFLPDYREEGELALLAKWKAGNLTLVNEQDSRGYFRAMEELAGISLDGIVRFYGVTEEFAERMRKAKA